MTDTSEIFEDVSNPLDCVEDILGNQEWTFTRHHIDELSVQVKGTLGLYRLTFVWQEDSSALQFFCEYDMQIPSACRDVTARALCAINERLWLGHFDLPASSQTPIFRHTSLFRGWTQTSNADHVEDLVEIALETCERYHNLFSMLSSSVAIDDKVLTLMLADQAGAA